MDFLQVFVMIVLQVVTLYARNCSCTLKSHRKYFNPGDQASLEKLISLDADILCEGHFGIYIGKNKIQGFITSFL